MITLYHYVHCPFCLRVRMAFGFLGIPFKSVVLSYEDEETPVSLSGHKMLPFIINEDQSVTNESLDIIKHYDADNKLNHKHFNQDVNQLLSLLGANIHNLCMPYWIYTKEFSPQARQYFQEKKEKKRGPFHLLIQNKSEYLTKLKPLLSSLEKELSPYYKGETLSLSDICIASHLWGMYIFPEFQFSNELHQYLQRVAKECKFEYHEDLWLEN